MLNRDWFYSVPGQAPHHEERKVTWLELFYDLVYVATIIQLGNLLSKDFSLLGFGRFVVVFIPIWWTWTGITFFATRFVIDDVWHRLLLFLQMAAIAALALSVEGVFGDLYHQFVFAYVVARLILALLYVRAWLAVPEARSLTAGYAVGFAIGAALWLVSAFVPEPARYALWAAGLLVEFATPLSPAMRRWQSRFPPDVGHVAERYGVFTLIVLGESFVKVIDGLAGTHLTLELVVMGLVTVGVAAALWWLYFDDIGGSQVQHRGLPTYVWIYSHLPLTLSITTFGVAAKKILLLPTGQPLADKYRLLLGIAVVLFCLFLGLMDRVTSREDDATPNKQRALWRFAAVAVLAAWVAISSGASALTFLLIIFLVFLVGVALNLRRARAKPG